MSSRWFCCPSLFSNKIRKTSHYKGRNDVLSRATDTLSPSCPALPSTLMRSWRNLSKASPSKRPSPAGREKSMTNLCLFEVAFTAFGYIVEKSSMSLLRRELSKAVPQTDHFDGGSTRTTRFWVLRCRISNRLLLDEFWGIGGGVLYSSHNRVQSPSLDIKFTTVAYLIIPKICRSWSSQPSARILEGQSPVVQPRPENSFFLYYFSAHFVCLLILLLSPKCQKDLPVIKLLPHNWRETTQ